MCCWGCIMDGSLEVQSIALSYFAEKLKRKGKMLVQTPDLLRGKNPVGKSALNLPILLLCLCLGWTIKLPNACVQWLEHPICIWKDMQLKSCCARRRLMGSSKRYYSAISNWMLKELPTLWEGFALLKLTPVYPANNQKTLDIKKFLLGVSFLLCFWIVHGFLIIHVSNAMPCDGASYMIWSSRMETCCAWDLRYS